MSKDKKTKKTSELYRLKREPARRRTGNEPPKARRPQEDTLTLKKFKELFGEQIMLFEDGKEFPCQQEALERRRPAVEAGDVLALFSALRWCRRPSREGFSFEDATLNPELNAREPVCEVPRWLLNKLSELIWDGMHGRWPKPSKGSTHKAREAFERSKDLVRAAHVLKAREDDVPWKAVFEHVSKNLQGAGAPRTVEDAYERVAKAFREDPTPYLFLPPVPQDWQS